MEEKKKISTGMWLIIFFLAAILGVAGFVLGMTWTLNNTDEPEPYIHVPVSDVPPGYRLGGEELEFIHRSPDLIITDAAEALQLLKEGNERYTSYDLMPRTTDIEDRELTSEGQWPFAIIISCSDSRTAPEIYFDKKVGDLFVIRNVGNVMDEAALGSLEFAVAGLEVPLIVVVGHDGCGAVSSAYLGVTGLSDNWQTTIDKISQNIVGSQSEEQAIQNNILAIVQQIMDNPVVQRMGATVIEAHYEVSTGVVDFGNN
jgi:carbonic anhydrase